MLCFFFFKQKTAYEMRISDWSSDVCSSDLVDIVFANEEEVCSLYDAADFDAALQAVRAHCEVAALTRSEKGAVIVAGDAVHVVDVATVARSVERRVGKECVSTSSSRRWPEHSKRNNKEINSSKDHTN